MYTRFWMASIGIFHTKPGLLGNTIHRCGGSRGNPYVLYCTPLWRQPIVCMLVPHFRTLLIEAEARPRDVVAPVTLLPYGTRHHGCAPPVHLQGSTAHGAGSTDTLHMMLAIDSQTCELTSRCGHKIESHAVASACLSRSKQLQSLPRLLTVSSSKITKYLSITPQCVGYFRKYV